LKIPITAAAAKAAVQKYRNLPEENTLEKERPQYSKAAFMDALVEFVIGNDQVCICLIEYYFT
jgi:hypothetical protein